MRSDWGEPDEPENPDEYEYAEPEKDPDYKECAVCGLDELDCPGHPSVAWPEEWRNK